MDVVYARLLFSLTGFTLATLLFIELQKYRVSGFSMLGLATTISSMVLWAEIGYIAFATKYSTQPMTIVSRRNAIAITIVLAMRCFLTDGNKKETAPATTSQN